MTDFDTEIKRIFIEEAKQTLEEAEQAYLDLSKGASRPLFEKLFRLAHNLKGSSKAVGFKQVADFTHHLESFLLKYKEGELEFSDEVASLLLRCNDHLNAMILGLDQDFGYTSDYSEFLLAFDDFKKKNLPQQPQDGDIFWADEGPAQAVQGGEGVSLEPPQILQEPSLVTVESSVALPSVTQAATGIGQGATSEGERRVHETYTSEPREDATTANTSGSLSTTQVLPPTEVKQKHLHQDVPLPQEVQSHPVPVHQHAQPPRAAPPAENAAQGTQAKSEETIRVTLSRIDDLQNMVGEMLVLQSVLSEQLRQDKNTSMLVKSAVRQLQKVSKDIQDTAMGMRMVPIKPMFQKMQRIVRDTSEILNKKINLSTRGEETEVDKMVFERLSDPLVHMVRNALDHGIEHAEERVKKGKKPEGQLCIEATHEGGQLVIRIIDDGKGLNPQFLYEKALQKGVIKAGQQLSEEQCYGLIFAPGFSTAKEVTEVSGRGVGMDVVRTNIEDMRGNIKIASAVDKGTTFTIQIPLSLAIIEAMIVSCANEKFIIPLHHVRETIHLRKSRIEHVVDLGDVMVVRGENIPVVELRSAFGLGGPGLTKDAIAVVIQDRGKLLAVAVDNVLSIQPVVTKAIGPEMRTEQGFIGSAILGDGKASLILEVSALLNSKKFQSNMKPIELRKVS